MLDLDRLAQTNRFRAIATGEKLAFSASVVVAAFAVPTPGAALSLCGLVAVLLVAGARVPARAVAKAAAVPAGFLALGALAQIVTLDMAGGVPLPRLAGAGLLPAIVEVTLRSAAAMAGLLFLTLTTPLTSLVQLAQRAGLPGEITDLALMMFRLVTLLVESLGRGRAALAARLGFSSRRRALASTGLLMAGLLPRTLHRARRLEQGLAARGYDGALAFLSVERKVRPLRLALALAAPLLLALSVGRFA